MSEELSLRSIWQGRYRDLFYEIHNWGDRDERHPTGRWNYYIDLVESEIQNVNEIFLTPKPSFWIDNYLTYPYDDSPLSKIYWHHGLTFHEVTNEINIGRRILKIGCDYQHLSDEGIPYTVPGIIKSVKRTIDELLKIIILK
jgi:hypothetical protein